MIHIKSSTRIFAILLISFVLMSVLVPTAGLTFTLFGKVKEKTIKLDVVNYLDENISKNTWDITIVTPKKIKKNKVAKIIVFFKIREKDFRSKIDVIYDGSNYNIVQFRQEDNTSRYIAVPRRSSSLWLSIEDRVYPFKGIDSLELKCQLVVNERYVPAKHDDVVILNNEHIERIEPVPYGKEGIYQIKIYLTSEGDSTLNDIARNDHSIKLGLRIGFISYTTQEISYYTTQEIPQNYLHDSITIYTKYSLENTERLIDALLNKKQKL